MCLRNSAESHFNNSYGSFALKYGDLLGIYGTGITG